MLFNNSSNNNILRVSHHHPSNNHNNNNNLNKCRQLRVNSCNNSRDYSKNK